MGDQENDAPPEPTESAPPAELQPQSTEEAATENQQASEQPTPPPEESKPDEPTEEPKIDEPQPDETQLEKHKSEEAKPGEPHPEEAKPEESKPEEPQTEEAKPDEEARPEKPASEEFKDGPPVVEEAESEKIEKKPSQEEAIEGKASEEKRESKISFKQRSSQRVQKSSELMKMGVSSESMGRKTRSLTKADDSKEGRRRSTRTERLGSKGQKVLGSIISIHRLSAIGEFYDRSKVARYMNTYKLDSDNPFNPDKVQQILETVMVEALENLTYDPEKCPKQAKWASSAIRAKVKELQFDRYKLICLVTIGEKNSQDILVTCRFLWDVERDRYATYSMENTYVFGIAICFGLYYE